MIKPALAATCCLILALSSCSTSRPTTPVKSEQALQRQRVLLDADWLFHLGDISPNDAITATYDDSRWRHIDVPHDYVLDGKYAQSEDKAVRSHGYLPAEIA